MIDYGEEVYRAAKDGYRILRHKVDESSGALPGRVILRRPSPRLLGDLGHVGANRWDGW
jgi:hypothetical protein